MSFQITTAFVQQYSNAMMLVAQQKGSRLRSTVTVETGVGSDYYFDFVGTVEAMTINERHGDSPLNATPHTRRRVDLTGYDTGDLIDDLDKVQTLADPTSAYVMAHGAAMGRAMDDVIIAAALADAKTGVDGSSTTSFDSNNVVAVNSWAYGSGSGNAGLTVSKLIEARGLLMASETIEAGEPVYLVCAQQQISDLLATTEATSADYNSVQALVRGNLDSFMGFNFVRSERLATDGSGYRRVLAYTSKGMALAIGKDITSQVAPRPDKRFSTYAYFKMFIGATRLRETDVVEIKCLES